MVHQRRQLRRNHGAVVHDGIDGRPVGVQGGPEADVPQDVGHVHGARARVVEADHAAV